LGVNRHGCVCLPIFATGDWFKPVETLAPFKVQGSTFKVAGD